MYEYFLLVSLFYLMLGGKKRLKIKQLMIVLIACHIEFYVSKWFHSYIGTKEKRPHVRSGLLGLLLITRKSNRCYFLLYTRIDNKVTPPNIRAIKNNSKAPSVGTTSGGL